MFLPLLLLWYILEWQMLLPVVGVVTTIVIVAFWADVIAKVADVIATISDSSYLADVVVKVADVIATVCDSSYFGRCRCQGG